MQTMYNVFINFNFIRPPNRCNLARISETSISFLQIQYDFYLVGSSYHRVKRVRPGNTLMSNDVVSLLMESPVTNQRLETDKTLKKRITLTVKNTKELLTFVLGHTYIHTYKMY